MFCIMGKKKMGLPLDEVEGWAASLLPLVMLFASSGALGVGAFSGTSPTTSNSTSFSKSSLQQTGADQQQK